MSADLELPGLGAEELFPVAPENSKSEATPVRLNNIQRDIFDNLLSVGGRRPVAREGLSDDLKGYILDGTSKALNAWREPSMFLGKSALSSIRKCEGMVLADAEQKREYSLPMPTAIGIVTHRAIQMSHTHGDRTPDELVKMAIAGSMTEESFAAFMNAASDWTRSELISEAVNKTVSFLDTFPKLDKAWTPRFEVSFGARVGSLSMSGRPDLSLGRPKADGTQSMFLCDFKTGAIREDHYLEAQFYALLATLRNGVPPFRSCVFSLADGEWTTPDVTEESLFLVAEAVVDAVTRRVEVLTELREPTYTPGIYCRWCPAAASCESADPDARPAANPVPVSLDVSDVATVSVSTSKVETAVAPVTAGTNTAVEDDPYALD